MVTPGAPPVLPRIGVLIVDRHLAFRDALGTRLQGEPDLTVVAKAQSAESVTSVLVGRSVDVLLLDAELPDGSATVFCAGMTRHADAPRVVMVGAASDPELIVAALRAGAAAWVRKDESIDHLLRVIRGVVRGETWLPQMDLGPVLCLLIEGLDSRRDCDDLLAALTPREREVLLHFVDGADRKEVAERLHMSANTVRTHLQSLMAKLGVHSTLEAVALARPGLETSPGIRELRRPAPWDEDRARAPGTT